MTMDCLRAIAEKAGGFENITGLVFHDSVIWVKEFTNSPLKESDFEEIGGSWCFVETLKYRHKKTYEYSITAKDYHDLHFLMHVITMTPEDRKNVDSWAYNDLRK